MGEGTTRRGTATPVHRPQRPAGSTRPRFWLIAVSACAAASPAISATYSWGQQSLLGLSAQTTTHTPLRPLRGLQESRVATREESGVLGHFDFLLVRLTHNSMPAEALLHGKGLATTSVLTHERAPFLVEGENMALQGDHSGVGVAAAFPWTSALVLLTQKHLPCVWHAARAQMLTLVQQ